MTLLFSLMLDLPWYKGFVWLSGLLLNIATDNSVTLARYMGSSLTCNHSKPHFLYEVACSYCSSEFLLCFWQQGPWGHCWALKTLSIPTCNPLTDPAHEPGALFKLSLGLQLFQLQLLWDVGLQLSHNPDLALNPADPDLPHHYKLSWWFVLGFDGF